MRLSITHTTEYQYDQPVAYALQKCASGRSTPGFQSVKNWAVEISGGRVETHYRDHYGNHVDLVSADIGTQALTLTATGTISTQGDTGILGMVYGRAPLWHFAQNSPLTKPGSAIRELAQTIRRSSSDLDGLHALSSAVLDAVPYEVGKTNSDTSAEDAVKIGRGVCQDHAHIFIAAAREAGMPARYVSGYLMMNDRVDQDASHAWAEAHVAGLGWVGFDVSNGVSPDERYVRIATGRDARDAAHVSGLRRGDANEAMTVRLQVQQ